MKGTVFVVKLESGDIQDTLEALKVAFYIPTITIETVSCLFFPPNMAAALFLKDGRQTSIPSSYHKVTVSKALSLLLPCLLTGEPKNEANGQL